MVEKDNDDYQSGKNKCSNRTGHYIERSPNPEKWKYYFMVQLLTISQNFIKSILWFKKAYIWKGSIFHWYVRLWMNYSGRNNNRENCHFIPKIGDSFSIIAMKYL